MGNDVDSKGAARIPVRFFQLSDKGVRAMQIHNSERCRSCPCRDGCKEAPDCESLVRRFLAGDSEAGNALHDRFQFSILGEASKILKNVLGISLVEESVQEIWEDVFRPTKFGKPQLLNWIERPVHEQTCSCKKCRGPLCAWLLTIARNTSLSIRIRETALQDRVKPLPDFPIIDPKTSGDRIRQEIIENIQWCIEQLSDDDQRLYEFIFVEDMKPKQCAEILGKSEEAFYFRQRRLLARFTRLWNTLDGDE